MNVTPCLNTCNTTHTHTTTSTVQHDIPDTCRYAIFDQGELTLHPLPAAVNTRPGLH